MYTFKKGDGGQWELWVWAVYGTETTFPQVFALKTPKEPKEEFFRHHGSSGPIVIVRDPEAGKTYVLSTRFEGHDDSFTTVVEVVDDPTYTPEGAVPCLTVV